MIRHGFALAISFFRALQGIETLDHDHDWLRRIRRPAGRPRCSSSSSSPRSVQFLPSLISRLGHGHREADPPSIVASLALRPLWETRRPRRARDHPLPRLLPQLVHKQVHQGDPTRPHRCHHSRPSPRIPNCRTLSHAHACLDRPSGQETEARRRVQWRSRVDRPRPPRTPSPLCSPLERPTNC